MARESRLSSLARAACHRSREPFVIAREIGQLCLGMKLETTASGRTRIPLRLWVLGLLAVASAGFCGLALWRGWVSMETLKTLLAQAQGPGAMAIYIGAAVGFQLLWLPRMWSLIVAGLFFGPLVGIVLSMIADLLSATLLFALARFAGRRYVAQLLARRPRARALVELLARRRGLVTIFALRALPVHYTASSYAAGFAGVGWGTYLLGTATGILPGTLVFTFVGDKARDPSSPWFWVGVAVMVAVSVVGLLLARWFWRSFKRHSAA
ncbi:MAG: hypothetical protein CSA65_07945 [Proteobacteria bacterium]|nr:MAG: hypothetical protein CSA65_07945 [Pseudomonadota bacterium]